MSDRLGLGPTEEAPEDDAGDEASQRGQDESGHGTACRSGSWRPRRHSTLKGSWPRSFRGTERRGADLPSGPRPRPRLQRPRGCEPLARSQQVTAGAWKSGRGLPGEARGLHATRVDAGAWLAAAVTDAPISFTTNCQI